MSWIRVKYKDPSLNTRTSSSLRADRSASLRRHTMGGGGVPVTSHLISTLSPTRADKWFTSRALSSDTTDTPVNVWYQLCWELVLGPQLNSDNQMWGREGSNRKRMSPCCFSHASNAYLLFQTPSMIFSFFKHILKTGSAFAIRYKEQKLPAQLEPSDSTIDYWSSDIGPISVGKIPALHQLTEIDPISKTSCLKKLKMMDSVHVYCYTPSSETSGLSSMPLFI